MSCAAIQSGNHFLGTALAQIDCQAQAIGAYGFGALASPSSPAAALLLTALTLFVALFGLRLMFGEAPAGRDLVGEVLKVGIVLTLATSWPAWRVLAYDTVFEGPSELSANIGTAAGLPGSGNLLDQRLDAADASIVALTAFGTGRLTGGVVGASDTGDPTRGIALADQTGFSWGRVFFLVGTLAPLALVRLASGVLLAMAPIMAALLLFAGTRDIFIGWLRALGACLLAGLVLALCYSAELALLEGWLTNALAQRQANLLTPAVPTELVVIALSFAAVAFGVLGLIGRVMFFASPGLPRAAGQLAERFTAPLAIQPSFAGRAIETSDARARPQRLADAVAATLRREERQGGFGPSDYAAGRAGGRSDSLARDSGPNAPGALGTSFARRHRRRSFAADKRDEGG